MIKSVRASNMTLLETVNKQIFNTMKLDLSSFTLTRLGSPIVYIDLNKNKLKVNHLIIIIIVIIIINIIIEINSILSILDVEWIT